MIALLALALLTSEPPTRDGDRIGTATIAADGRLTMELRSVECDGTIVEGIVLSRPGDAGHAATVKGLGGIRPGETKPVVAHDLPRCDAR